MAVLHDANRGGPVFYTFWGSNSSSIASPIPVPLNRWTHLAFVYNHFYGAEGSSGRIYLNGTLVAEGPLGTTAPGSRSNNYLGKSNWSGEPTANAVFDDVRIWGTLLDQPTIDTWKGKELSTTDPHPQQYWLRGYWKFDETSGVIAHNTRPSGASYYYQTAYDGTLQSGAAWAESGAPMALPFSSTQSSSLAPGNTYNFRIAGNNGVGTTYGSSAGFTTTLPGCDAVANVAMDEDTTRTVTVSGITDNDPFETRVLSVTAASSNPGLLPSPTVTYSSPNPTANLQLVPAPNLSGTATVTVEVGYSVSGTVYKTSRSFTVTVNPVNDPPVAGPAYSLQFDGVNDYVRAGGIELASRSFTVEAWARNTRPNTWQMFVWQGQPEPNKGLVIGWRANNVFTFAFLYNDLNTSAAYDDQAWHHWACSTTPPANSAASTATACSWPRTPRRRITRAAASFGLAVISTANASKAAWTTCGCGRRSAPSRRFAAT